MKQIRNAAVLVSGILAVTSAQASSDFLSDGKQSNDVSGVVGIGIGALPEYDGSEDYQAIPFILGRVAYDKRYVEFIGTTLRGNVLNDSNWQFGPAANFRFGRDEDVENAVISRMSEVDDAFELGAFARYDYSPNWARGDSLGIETQFLQDVSDGHEGFELTMQVDYNRPITDKLRMGVDISTAYASDDYMESYFGVNAQNVGTSGLAAYDAEAGFKDIEIGWNTQYALNERWGVYSRLSYTQLIGDASDSPIVEDQGDDGQVLVGAGVSYRF